MRLRLAAAVLVPALALVVPTAGRATHAEEPLVVSGTILVGHPATSVVGGVTENLAPCTPDDPLNGVDGVWVDLLAYQGHEAVITMDDVLDVDVYFYTAGCVLLLEGTLADGFLGEPESGPVPVEAQFAVVDGFLGTGEFTMTVG